MKWCDELGHKELKGQVLQIRKQRLIESENRNNPSDDLKSAANDICTDLKRLFRLERCGNNGESIMRDSISKLITEDMTIYKELEQDIFG